MKQHITIEQFQQLSNQAQEKARTLLPKQIGSKLFAELSLEEPTLELYNGIYVGVLIPTEGTHCQVVYESKGTTGPFKYLKEALDYPLFSLGELIQIMKEHGQEVLMPAANDVDVLWVEVKKILEDKRN